jgi:DNA-binding transcriptional LysR family regulator
MQPDLDPNDLLLFARVAEAGSFTRAALRAGLPKSTLSRRISILETRLGERLLQRTTRKLALTDFGLTLLEHARQVASLTDAAAALAQHRQVEPSGRLRVSMPGDFAAGFMGQMLADYMVRYPAVMLEIDLSPRRVDLIGENFDLAIRMGELPHDSTLVALPIIRVTFGLYAAPAYIARRGQPASPDALAQHDNLALLTREGRPLSWPLVNGRARWEKPLVPKAMANSPDLLLRLALRGAGITGAALQSAAPFVEAGELLRVLPEWQITESPGYAVFPSRRLLPVKTRAFIDMLQAHFAGGCTAA